MRPRLYNIAHTSPISAKRTTRGLDHSERETRADGTTLRVCRQRPDRRTAKQRDEFAPLHSITSSARASNVAGTSMPSALAVCKLMLTLNLVARSTGMSAGFAPFRILSTKAAAR
jgi:hypothetical protein